MVPLTRLNAHFRLTDVSSGKRFFTRRIFYNDKLEVFRPFNNIVKMKFDESTCGRNMKTGLSHDIPQLKGRLSSSYGDVGGVTICNKGATGYVSFVNSKSKEAALAWHKKENDIISSFEVEDYNVGQSRDAHEFRPFRYVMVVAYRPTVHAAGRIIKHLTRFGTTSGRDLVYCPYDKNRCFLYISFPNGSNFAFDDPMLSKIDPNLVSRDHQQLDNNDPANTVLLYPFLGNCVGWYRTTVNVRTKNPVPSRLINDFMDEQYGDVRNVVQHKSTNEGETDYTVTFYTKYPVFRMFYQRTHYGRVIETLPNTSEQLSITIPSIPHPIWRQSALRLLKVKIAPQKEEDVIGFFNDFLDRMGCNPGIVSVCHCGDQAYELSFTNLWHVHDVLHRLIKLRYEGKHNYYIDKQ